MRDKMRFIVFSCLLAVTFGVKAAISPAKVQYKHVSVAETFSNKSSMLPEQFKSLGKKQQQIIAAAWDLTPKEYSKYLFFIDYTPDRTSYAVKTTDPLWILAAHTKDKALYYKYLKQSIEIEREELGRMLRVQRDFDRLAHKLYPNEYAVTASWLTTKGLQAGDVVQLFCKPKDATCGNMLQVILPRIRTVSGSQLDIFAVGKVSAKQLIEFGKQNGVKRAEVANRKVTLNFGGRAFSLLESEAKKKLPLPFVVVRREGKEVAIDIRRGSDV